MNENYYEFIDEAKAINILEFHKGNFIATTVDLETGKSEHNYISKEEGKEVIRAVQAIVLDNDEFVPHMICYTYTQNNIKHIIRKGIMYDILL